MPKARRPDRCGGLGAHLQFNGRDSESDIIEQDADRLADVAQYLRPIVRPDIGSLPQGRADRRAAIRERHAARRARRPPGGEDRHAVVQRDSDGLRGEIATALTVTWPVPLSRTSGLPRRRSRGKPHPTVRRSSATTSPGSQCRRTASLRWRAPFDLGVLQDVVPSEQIHVVEASGMENFARKSRGRNDVAPSSTRRRETLPAPAPRGVSWSQVPGPPNGYANVVRGARRMRRSGTAGSARRRSAGPSTEQPRQRLGGSGRGLRSPSRHPAGDRSSSTDR